MSGMLPFSFLLPSWFRLNRWFVLDGGGNRFGVDENWHISPEIEGDAVLAYQLGW
jgi:hypothetical protein